MLKNIFPKLKNKIKRHGKKFMQLKNKGHIVKWGIYLINKETVS